MLFPIVVLAVACLAIGFVIGLAAVDLDLIKVTAHFRLDGLQGQVDRLKDKLEAIQEITDG
jgi:hypothetical protein